MTLGNTSPCRCRPLIIRLQTLPLFMAVLDQCLPDKEDQRLLQLFCGNILLPNARFETALVCIGGAGTGKSTLAEAVGGALGQGVVMQSSLQQICSANGYHLPGLRHSLVNLGTELNATEMADSSVFKSLVSGEAIEAREIYGKPGVDEDDLQALVSGQQPATVQARHRGRSASLEVP